MTKLQKTFLALIILLAVFFRFYQIAAMPGGLFPDEAANGLDINLMQQGQLQPFYERGNGREALFFYMQWASVELFGKGPWQHHAVSALIGVFSVVLCFLATRRLFSMQVGAELDPALQNKIKNRAVWIALLAAFLMAVSSWHVVLSRTAFRANLIPLFTTLTFYLLLKTYEAPRTTKRLLFGFLTGASFALGFYTYIAYRIMVPILGVLLLWPFLVDVLTRPRFEAVKKYWKAAALSVIGFVIFIYPLAKYFYAHPDAFVGRSGQVSVFNPELNQGSLVGAIAEVTKESLLGFFTHGDLNWRHNISGFPFLSPVVSPFFGVGLVAVTFLAAAYIFMPRKKMGWWKFALLAGWFWGMLIPVIMTAEGIPHGLRSIGMIPAVFIVSAWALYEFGAFIMKLHNRLWQSHSAAAQADPNLPGQKEALPHKPGALGYKIVTLGFKLVVVCFCLALIAQTYILYFVYAANSPENFYSFRSDLTPVSCYLMYYGDKQDTYLVLDKFSVQTPDYITFVDGKHPDNLRNNPYKQVDPENAWELPALKPGDQAVFTQSSIFDTYKFKQHHPEANLTYEMRNKFGQAVMAVYTVPRSPADSFMKFPYDYSNANLKIPGQCKHLFGPEVKLY